MLGRRALLFPGALVLLLAMRAAPVAASDEWVSAPPTEPLLLRAGDEDAGTSVAPPAEFFDAEAGRAVSAAAGETANITVTYTGFTPQAKAAFQFAVDVWKTQIKSPVEIKIDARWKPLPTGVLGMASPASMQINLSSGQLCPVALANRLAGKDLEPKAPDIIAEFNSTLILKWYYGTDGRPPSGKYDLATVVLHEIGHGLGFVNSTQWVLGNGLYGFGGPFPLPFDTFLSNNGGSTLIAMYPNASLPLGAAITNGAVFWNGLGGIAAAGGVMPQMYAPKAWEQGSSIGHLDEKAYGIGNPNSLMTPILSYAEAIHDPGPIVRGMMDDMGWGESTPAAVFAGKVSGGPEAGHAVVAMVQIGTRTTVCGQGETTTSGADVVYVVEVAGSDVEGCGRKGAAVTFYFPATHQVATKTADWPATGGLAEFNVSVGTSLSNSRRLPGIAGGK